MSILTRILSRKPEDAPETQPPSRFDTPAFQQRLRKLEGSAAAERAAEMLTAPTALMQLTPEEARVVVS